MARTDTLPHFLTDVADAIRTKGGTSGTIQASSFDTAIANLPSGGGSTEDDVFFYDYDGTVVESYTKDEFLALTELPANPTHTGLTSQGWNWTLSAAKTYVTDYTKLNIGQMYVTSDNSTKIYVHLEKDRLSPYLSFGLNGTATVDWGDSSSTNSTTGSSLTTLATFSHGYAQEGDYVITITLNAQGEMAIFGNSSSYVTNLFWKNKTASSQAQENRVYASTIEKIELGSNVRLGDYAFGWCSSLKAITIPSTLTSLGTYCVYKCTSLRNIVLPTSFTTFGSQPFRESGIEHVELPNTISSIPSSCFTNCYVLKDMTIPSSITTIPNSCFATCYCLETIIMPNTITYIGNYAFNACQCLREITLPSNLSTLGESIFYSCTTLKEITIPNTITQISYQCFNSCSNLTKITLPSTITSIGEAAFQNCKRLLELTIPSGVTTIPKNCCGGCESLQKVTLAGNVTSIGDSSFANCYSLEEMNLPNTVTSLTQSSFNGCYALKTINLPSGITSIPTYAFNACYVLTNAYFLGDVTDIAANAFGFCKGIARFDFTHCTTVPTLANTNAFNNASSDFRIVVPDALYDTWIAANNWSTYSGKIYKESAV